MDEPPVDKLPEWSDSELVPLISLKDRPVVDMMDMTGCQLPKSSEVLSPRSPVTIGFEDQDVLSGPLSPNRLQEGRSQDMPAEGSIFDISPDLLGFSMRPAGVGLQLPDITEAPPSTYSSFNDPFFGAPIAFGADSFGLESITRQYTLVNRGGHHKGHFEGRTLRCECYPNGYGG